MLKNKTWIIILIILIIVIAALSSLSSYNLAHNSENMEDGTNNTVLNEDTESISQDKDVVATNNIDNKDSGYNFNSSSEKTDNSNQLATNGVSNNQVTEKNNFAVENENKETIDMDTKPSQNEESTDTNKQETLDERMVTIKAPIYGESYREYWIKVNDDIIWIGKTYDEQQEVLDNLSNDDFANATYGSKGTQDIIGYEIYVMTESDYIGSYWHGREDVIVSYDN